MSLTSTSHVEKDPSNNLLFFQTFAKDKGALSLLSNLIVCKDKPGKFILVVPSLTLQWINTTIVNCVELFCSVQSLKSQQVNFSWTRAGLYLHHTSSNISSTLTLCKPNWTDGDTIKCHANYSNKVIVTSISLPCNFGGCKKGEKTTKFKKQWIIIAVISTCAGLLFLCVLGFAIFKCKKRAAANGSIVYRNKIYENFTFSTTTINPVLNPQNAQLGATSNKRSTTGSYPQTIRQTQREECIYEN
ncbi:uncharacterized protein LOC124393557 [Silurus meridionalis]|uniref:uncharacterized protein LOC124393557 n=1 Tax=Silurus meridionalis TaxID=175797 RepID=UPI001EEBF97B|nr:uncharacterized protein LOC124393557 [Silurus meridionalis]